MRDPVSMWAMAAAAIAMTIAGRACIALGFPSEAAGALGAFLIWLGSCVVVFAMLNMPTPPSTPTERPRQGTVRRMLWRAAAARRWSRDAAAALVLIYSAVLGVVAASLINPDGEILPTFVLGVFVCFVAPVCFPAALLGLALCPNLARHHDRKRDANGRRYHRLMKIAGFCCGLLAVVLILNRRQVIATLERVPFMLTMEAIILVLPAMAAFATVRMGLAFGWVRRAGDGATP